MTCRLTLLGGFFLCDGGGAELALATRKDRLLLAYLALTFGRPQLRDRLAGLLWGDRGEGQARDSLRQSLASMRQAFRKAEFDPLWTDRDSVSFDPTQIKVDVLEFATLADSAPEQAALLYRGDLLEGMDGITPEFEEWLLPERQRLTDLAVRVLEETSARCAPSTDVDGAIALGRRLIAGDRLREAAYRALMRLQARKGDRAEALKLYAACRDALQRELGVAPDAATEAAHRAILGEHVAARVPSAPVAAVPFESTPDKLSIAVLPFDNLSGDPQQQYFSDGFTEDIITELSRFRSLYVVARNSSFAFRGAAVDVRKLGRELGVRFVVEGSVRRAGDMIRISVQLLDAGGGNHLWAERYDRPIAELFTVQDEVVQTIVATIAARLEGVEISGARRQRTDNLVAYDCLLRGIEHARGYEPDDNRLARELFERAIALDPDYALAHAYLALAYMMEHGYSRAPEPIKERALDSALKAVRLDPDEVRCHQYLSQVYTNRGQHDLALFHLERSLALNPNDPNGMSQYGLALAKTGRVEEGIGWIQRAMRVNPFHPSWYWGDLAIALYMASRFEEALEANQRVAAGSAYGHARIAACYAQLGRMEEAKEAAAQALRLDPGFRLGTLSMSYKFDVDRERVLDGMRKAGLPD
jgi:TolB-like protein/Flp pilus assembly protein TadD